MPDAFSRSSCGMKHRGQNKYLRESSLVEAKVPRSRQESRITQKGQKKSELIASSFLFRVRDTALQPSRSSTSLNQACRFLSACRG